MTTPRTYTVSLENPKWSEHIRNDFLRKEDTPTEEPCFINVEVILLSDHKEVVDAIQAELAELRIDHTKLCELNENVINGFIDEVKSRNNKISELKIELAEAKAKLMDFERLLLDVYLFVDVLKNWPNLYEKIRTKLNHETKTATQGEKDE
jgi:inosine/xanthosine triphosphate pyrophosphatase family protein